MDMSYYELVNLLNKTKAKIVFEKADGSLREMEVTRNLSWVPEESQPKGDEPKPAKLDKDGKEIIPTAVKVYSFGDVAWRSFKVDSLKSLEVISGS